MEIQEWHRWWNRAGAVGLRAILLNSWDPAQARGAAEAEDEYDGYLGPLGSLLRRGVSEKGVAEYLVWCEEQMGLVTPVDKLAPVAAEIVRWYSFSIAAEERL